LARMNMERRQSEAQACEQLVAQHAETAAAALLSGPTGAHLPAKPAPQQSQPPQLLPLEPARLRFA
jgi:hypothetical protein